MDIEATANDLLKKGKAALDANGDGKIEAKEVLDALGERAKQTADAAVEAAEEVRKGLDANSDGEISVDEVKAVAEGVVDKVKKGLDADGDGEISADEVKAAAEGVFAKAKGAVKDLLGND